MADSKNPNVLYEKSAKETNSSIDFWGDVPKSLNEAVDLAIQKYNPHTLLKTTEGKDKFNQFRSILTEYHKKLGLYTPKVEQNLELLKNGAILMGQQPIVFGGPGFIGNKIGCMLNLLESLQESNLELAPVYFVGDYDGLQKELARQYYPNPISHTAFILDSEEYLPEDTEIAAHAATLPPQTWLDDYLSKLEDNIAGFRKQVKGSKKVLFDERWSHIKTLLKTTFMQSNTLSEWGARIWGYITNVVVDYGIIFLPTSHPEIRKIIAPQYTRFIKNRKLYTEQFQNAMDQVKELGFEPTLPHRHENYAPFTLECHSDHNRVTTHLVEKDGKIFAEGECPACEEIVSVDVTTEDDVMKIATQIGPRVDTSQAIFQELLNIQIRISGPGEIAYYAQAAPAVKSIGFDLPIFVKYKRAFYNAPWIENLGKQLSNRNQGSLHQGQLFSLLRQRMDAEKEDDEEGVQQAEYEMNEFIEEQYNKLMQHDNSSDVQKYLGWQFGKFETEKFGQEVSWIWFDLAFQTGPADYINTYRRMYTPYSTVGGYYFINSLL